MVKTLFAVQNWVARAVRRPVADLSQGDATVAHHANHSSMVFIVLPLYSTLDSVNKIMLIAVVAICTIELFALTLILSR